jgi:hypothetical protein
VREDEAPFLIPSAFPKDTTSEQYVVEQLLTVLLKLESLTEDKITDLEAYLMNLRAKGIVKSVYIDLVIDKLEVLRPMKLPDCGCEIDKISVFRRVIFSIDPDISFTEKTITCSIC